MTSSAPLSETLRRVRIDEKPPTILTKVMNPGRNEGRKGEREQGYYQYGCMKYHVLNCVYIELTLLFRSLLFARLLFIGVPRPSS
jgi:hypothetical protein